MKQSIRAFGIGLFVAGVIFTVVEKSDLSSGTNKAEQSLVTYKKQVQNLEQQIAQLRETTASEKIESDKETSGTKEQQAITTENQSAGLDLEKDDIVEATVYIYEGMSLYEIGEQVEDLRIVENGRQVELYLSKPEYARSIQKGAFELRSDMTLEQIAKIITGKK